MPASLQQCTIQHAGTDGTNQDSDYQRQAQSAMVDAFPHYGKIWDLS